MANKAHLETALSWMIVPLNVTLQTNGVLKFRHGSTLRRVQPSFGSLSKVDLLSSLLLLNYPLFIAERQCRSRLGIEARSASSRCRVHDTGPKLRHHIRQLSRESRHNVPINSMQGNIGQQAR